MFQLGPTEASSVAAEPVIATVVRRAPQGQPIGKISTHGPWAGQRVRLLVLGGALDSTGRRWLRVRLLRRPNESDGWIPYDRVRIVRNPWRVEIVRASKELTVLRRGAVVARYTVAVGSPATPTPKGLFAIAESFPTTQPGVAPWAIALTAFSESLDSFAGGPGLVAIHGGCGGDLDARLRRGAARGDRALAQQLPAGTPVRDSLSRAAGNPAIDAGYRPVRGITLPVSSPSAMVSATCDQRSDTDEAKRSAAAG